MEPLEPTTGRGVRLALVGFGLLALLTVVALASRSGFGGSSKATPTPSYVSYALTAFLIVFVLMIPVAVYLHVIQVREQEVARRSFKSRVVRNLLTLALFSLISLGVIYLKRHNGHIFNFNLAALQNLRPKQHGQGAGKAAPYQPTFEWPVLAVAVVALAGAAAYTVLRRRRRLQIVTALDPTVAEDLVATIGDAIGDLEAEPDARRAVIAAYARMEVVLARHGLHRSPSETAIEYLGRILGGLTSRSEAVARLTRLFEEAKFSRHEIDGSMKTDAIAALRAVRDDLRAEAA